MQGIRSVLTPETADSEYAIRTKINELQKERKALLAKALAENDDGKYDFQFLRIKQELEQLQAQLEGVQAMQKTQAVDEVRMDEIAALLEKFKESGLAFDDLLVRKVVENHPGGISGEAGGYVQGREPQGGSSAREGVNLSTNIKSCETVSSRR